MLQAITRLVARNGSPKSAVPWHERLIEIGLFACGALSVLVTGGILLVLAFETFEFFRGVSLGEFLGDTNRVVIASSPEKAGLAAVTEAGLAAAVGAGTTATVTAWKDETAGREAAATSGAEGASGSAPACVTSRSRPPAFRGSRSP